MRNITFKNGISVPTIGQGSWRVGDSSKTRNAEIEALQAGIDAGMTLIDTAEMYGNGNSELLICEAIRPFKRETLFLVSKVLPSNAGRKDMRISCENSIKRLGTDYLDLYLYHWRGHIPLAETVTGLEELKRDGLIKEWGVSNFDIDDMEELFAIEYGENCLVNQVLYHTGSRGIEFSLLPWMRQHDVTLMSYCPLAQAGALKRGLLEHPVFSEIAGQHHVTPAQIILAWNIRGNHTIAIPKSGSKEHCLNNAAAADISLTNEELAMIDKAFPTPDHKVFLDME